MVCAGAAAWLMAGRDDGTRRARLMLAGAGRAAEPSPRRPSRPGDLAEFLRARLGTPSGQAWWCVLSGTLLGLLGESWLPVVAGAAAVPVVRRLLVKRQRGKANDHRAAAVIELCAAVSGELRAGRQPDRALLSVGGIALRELGDAGAAVLAAARFGGDVPGALREAARTPGAEGLRGVAACWQVAVEGGAGLATGLDKVGDALRAEREQCEELRALLAGPRSTAVVLALLPVFGLLLGTAMGAAPVRVLLHSTAGLLCLAVGGLLEWAGIAWVARLVRTAERSGGVRRGEEGA
ncbi:type II secretion system F family protein [Streptomyces sp. WMMB 322]|uniref:type II secretion system F family protein n=1 Tax=Streptomyces sp. WMMB 322 TaxID=1286821 RepID=UPI0006E2F567|nr:type II secretion system F family protein [Streptomyces sp. WMMB 322]